MTTTSQPPVDDRDNRQSTQLMVRRITQLLVGLFLFGLGIAFLIRSDLGASPWDVLTQGISQHINLTFGTITVITSGIVMLLWIPLRQKLGMGTVLNALLVGLFADVSFLIVPETSVLWLRVLYVAVGIIIVGLATGFYIGARFGPGPRDGLMTGLNRITGQPIWKVRVAIEVTVLAIGWLLGGTVGIGTVAFAVFIGSVCQFFLRIFTIQLPSDPKPEGSAEATVESTQPQVEKAPSY